MSPSAGSYTMRLQAAADVLSTSVVLLDRTGRVLWV